MHNAPAELLTEIMLTVFKLNGQLLKHGDRKAEHLGLTSARWQMLGAIALSPVPRSAPQLARKMAISRQGAQKQLNLLSADKLVVAEANPRNARSPLYRLTEKGEQVYLQTEQLQKDWTETLARALDADQLDATRRLLKKLSRELETNNGG
jgi:DNA-binding MarR family transcriptional regulator